MGASAIAPIAIAPNMQRCPAVGSPDWAADAAPAPKIRTGIYKGKTRIERHEELINYAIKGGISQARVAHEICGSKGRLHVNVLWEMGGAERVLIGIMEKAGEIIHGVTCGAGMPYRLGDIAAKFGIFYYPIISNQL